MVKQFLDNLNGYFNEVGEDFDALLADYRHRHRHRQPNLLKKKFEKKQLVTNLSLLEFLPFRSFDGQNCIFENKQTLGFILRVGHFSGMDESAKSAINNIINNDLPSGCTLQVINYASPKIGRLLDAWQKSGSQDEMFKKFSNSRAEFLARGSFSSLLGKRANLIVRDFELYFIFSMAKASSEYQTQAIIYSLKALQDKFTRFLKEINSDAYVLNDRDLANLLQELLNPTASLYKNQNIHRLADIRECLASSQIVKMQADRVVFANVLEDQVNKAKAHGSKENPSQKEVSYSVFEVVDWPGAWDLQSGIDYIGDFEKGISLPCPFYISMGYVLEDKEASQRTADKHRMIKTQQNDSKLPMFFPKMLEENNDWRYVSSMINRGERMGKLVMYIVLIHFDQDNIAKASQGLKDHFSRLDFKLERVKYDCLNSLIYTLPFGIGENWQILDQLKISSKKLSGACANLMPVFADSQNYTSPLMLFVGRRGQLFFFDNFKTADNVNGNFNMVVVGASGRGKSVWLQEYSMSLLKNGGQVVIIDDGRSFKNTCELLDGDFVDFGGGEFCINPFSLYKNADKGEDLKEYKENFEEPFIDLVVSILCIIANVDKNNTTDPVIGLYRSVLIDSVDRVMNSKGSKGGFSDIRDELIAMKSSKNDATKKIIGELEDILFSYTGQERYAKYFNGEATIDIKNRLTVFELSDLESIEALQSAVLLTVTFLVYAKIRGRNIPTSLIIDEFWRTGKHPVLKGPIGGFSRRGRKYNLSLIVASQCMSDFEVQNSEAGAICLSQSDWRIILSVDGKDDHILRNTLMMGTGEIEIAHSLRGMKGAYSEFMLRYREDYWQIGRLLLDPFSAQVFSSKAEDIAKIKQMRSKGMSVDEAIENLIKDNNS